MQILVMKIVFFPIFCFLNVRVCFSFSWKVLNGNNLVIKVDPNGRHRENNPGEDTAVWGAAGRGQRGGLVTGTTGTAAPAGSSAVPARPGSGWGRGGQAEGLSLPPAL